MNRRLFFSALAGAPAVAATVPAISRSAPPAFESLLEQTADGTRISFRGWSVWWSGWKEPVNALDKVAQWAAIPMAGEKPDESRLPFFVGSNGYSGFFRRGESLSIDWQNPWTAADAWSRQDKLDGLRRLSLRAMVELIHHGDWRLPTNPQPYCWARTAPVAKCWDKLSEDTRAFLDLFKFCGAYGETEEECARIKAEARRIFGRYWRVDA